MNSLASPLLYWLLIQVIFSTAILVAYLLLRCLKVMPADRYHYLKEAMISIIVFPVLFKVLTISFISNEQQILKKTVNENLRVFFVEPMTTS